MFGYMFFVFVLSSQCNRRYCEIMCLQINYADMLKRVEPLRDELHSLELQAEENKSHGEEVTDLITQLEHSIASYKEEYAQLISQAQAIKTDLENVQAKVGPCC
jgi:hypothetical protein